ncbi:kinesin-domain-containing protein [Russula earlei]|uniref:Kinesin-domain-containing protein n=1 Tax=Russula earlei TaxID=71964 RepID=A0ACC0U9V4_9AGAM|nr:kinesin-domain-containing protein [Russula earlei]
MATTSSNSTQTQPSKRLLRPTSLFTPRRSLSTSSSSGSSRFSTSGPLNALASAKKFKAALSSEARVRTTVKTKPPAQSPAPGTPTKRDPSRPKTPGTPRLAEDDPHRDDRSEMDVSRVDPEDVLVDWETVEPADISGEVDENFPRAASNGDQDDKVLVSIRVRPSESPSAWDTQMVNTNSIKLLSQHHRNAATTPPVFHFDQILTGSDNKSVYNTVARNHVCAAMDGYNAVVFAYGQTASGKTFTLSGDDDQPGIIPRAMKDIFAFIRRTPAREYLLRCSYLEIYNETIYDLLAPASAPAVQLQGSGANVWLAPLREEVVTSLAAVRAVIARGWAARRTATTDWNDRSSRSHSVFRVVIESRERGDTNGGRQTPGVPSRPPTPGGPRLQSIGGKSVQTSVLSLIDLAGSEKATSDKERTREGKYINTSLLTLGSVIATLAENASKGKSDHVPFRNSKLTRMLQPSLSGDARISVICTLNPDASAVAESTSTLQFAQRIKKVQLNAKKKEVVDTDALLERYRQEIEELKNRLAEKEKEADAPGKTRRLSAREQLDESKAMKDLNARIKQLTNLILTSQTVDENRGDESRPASPSKVDFDMTPYQLQQELLSARREIESQATQILALEAALLARPELPPDAPESEKDRLLVEQARNVRELEMVIKGYDDNLGAPLRAVREDVEREWSGRLAVEEAKRKEADEWATELARALEKEKKARQQLEDERRALAAFVTRFDSLTSSTSATSLASLSNTPPARASKMPLARLPPIVESPVRIDLGGLRVEPSLLEEQWDGGGMILDDESFDAERAMIASSPKRTQNQGKGFDPPIREVLGGKENLPA